MTDKTLKKMVDDCFLFKKGYEDVPFTKNDMLALLKEASEVGWKEGVRKGIERGVARGKTAGAYCQLCKKPRTDVGLCCVDCFQNNAKQERQAGRDEVSPPKGVYIEKALPLTKENLIRITETDEQTIKRLDEKLAALSKEKEELEALIKMLVDAKYITLTDKEIKAMLEEMRDENARFRKVLEEIMKVLPHNKGEYEAILLAKKALEGK